MYQVVVAGSINMDIVVTADRHPLVGETVRGTGLEYFPGGKGANQAVAAARLGANTRLVGKLGDDAFAGQLEQFLQEQNVKMDSVGKTNAAPTGTALITLANADNTIIVVPAANDMLTPDDVTSVDVAKGDVLLSQFEIPEDAIEAFFSHGKKHGATTILNPAPAKHFSEKLFRLVDVLVVNETELFFLSGSRFEGTTDLSEIGSIARNLRAHDEQVIIVTLGADGLLAVLGEREIRIEGRQVEAVDTTGAGDCFVGALAARISSGSTLEKSLEYANAAAALSVQQKGAGTSMPTRAEMKSAYETEESALK